METITGSIFRHACLCAISIICLLPGEIFATKLYRCELDGRVEFRQTACVDGKQSLAEAVNNSKGMLPAEPAVKLKKPSGKKPKQSRPKVAEEKSSAQRERCWRKRKLLERVEQRLRGGYKASQYQKLHNKQAEYEEYLSLFCES